VSDFIETLNFLNRFSKNTQISNLIKKIIPVGAELLYGNRRTEGRADTTKLMVAFRKIANALIKCLHGLAEAINQTQHHIDPWHSEYEDEARFVTARLKENF
jgi:hypothetical protein